ncbi:hypothetical protein PITC_064080 [Penicillium italicum]|uniref:Uncharacterized protein n=1 Tax=Penicillium italicum TaxID=40296 RepID=A0A0A2KTH8_PENIT|nr:hypothetical protein PITC_064080 [Penicillium italicum]
MTSFQLITILFSITIYTLHRYVTRRVDAPQPVTAPSIPESSVFTISKEDIHPAAEFHVPRIPYGEDTIVKIIHDIYRIYLQLNYLSPWEIIWPPEHGHAINQALGREELGLDFAVISLMKRLPYFRDYGFSAQGPFFPHSEMFVYLEDDQIRAGRDPEHWKFQEPKLDSLLPHEIALSSLTDEGHHLILDIKENTIRVWSFNEPPAGDDPDNYRMYSPHHAPTFLASHLERIRSLELIPSGSKNFRWLFDKRYPDYPKLKKILQEQYGWPYDFREEEWMAVSKVTWERIIREEPGFETEHDNDEPLDLDEY